MKRLMISTALAVALVSGPAMAEWKPKGPIKLWIGFGAGGGTDTQGRAIAEAIEKLKGWRIIPENKAGAGGTVMAAQLKKAAPDGQTIGFAINSTVDFATLKNKNLSIDDFTYITTTAGSQMAVIARKDSGWTTLEDMVAAAKKGEKVVWAGWGDQVEAAAEATAKHYGITVNHLRAKGGKGTMNALVAKDANLAWSGGAHRKLVAAGELVILASGEDKPLAQAPNGKTLRDYGVEFTLGFKFLIMGPKGMSKEARDAIASAIGEVMSQKDSKLGQYVAKRYPPGPVLITGDKLNQMLRDNQKANVKLLANLKK
ncbi:MAG: tripartite tricarboxylate transporter substrate binding protein [Hyphomicrobiaceae bacterium]